MGTPIKQTIGLHYCNSDTYLSYGESAVITLYTDTMKKKTTAKLEDENLMQFIKKIIDSGLISDKKLNGFLTSFSLGQNTCLQSSVNCVEGDVFDEEIGKKRAIAKVLVRREICINTLMSILEEDTAKRFTNMKNRFLSRMDCDLYYDEYFDAYANRKQIKDRKLMLAMQDTIKFLNNNIQLYGTAISVMINRNWITKFLFREIRSNIK